jgi:hypothetical protein
MGECPSSAPFFFVLLSGIHLTFFQILLDNRKICDWNTLSFVKDFTARKSNDTFILEKELA